MNDGWYLKRRHVPDQCPDCGLKGAWIEFMPLGPGFRPDRDAVAVPLHGRRLNITMADCLKIHYGTWKRELQWHPMWRFKMWRASCGPCAMNAAIRGPSMFQHLSTQDSWKGGTFQIPMGGR